MQRRIARAAVGFIGEEQPVQVAFLARDRPQRGWRLFRMWRAGRVTWLVVAGTDRDVYLFRRGLRGRADLRSVLRRYAIATTPVRLGSARGEIVIGEGSCWTRWLAARGDARDLVAFVRYRQRTRLQATGRVRAAGGQGLPSFVVTPARSPRRP